MKARILNLTAVAFALVIGVATAQAQQLVASIPFDFQVGTEHMPAGKYIVTITNGSLFAIRGANTPDATFVLTNSIASNHPEQESPRLVFFRSSNKYYLTQVWSPDLQDGRKIQLPRSYQMEANNKGGGQETTIAAARQ